MTVSFLRSIRFRLTFWYALTLAVILAASAFSSYHYFSRTLSRQVDAQLQTIAGQIASAHAEHAPGLPLDPLCCRVMEERINHGNWDAFLLLRGPNLQPLCASDNLVSGHLELGAVARAQARRLISHLETVEVGEGTSLRRLTYPLKHDKQLLGVVQVARDLGDLQQTLGNLRLVIALVGPFATFCLCLGCWVLAGRLVAQIIEVTNAAREVNADNLTRRLPNGGRRDELAQMVVTLNQMLERLENAFRRVRQFSGDASHELRTPLTILRGETEVTLRWAKQPEEFRDMLRSNLEEIDRMERIIENLLNLTKSDASELTLEFKECDLSDLVQSLYLQAQLLGEAKRITVALRVGVDQELSVRGDELRLRQLFLNLIANGIKYTPQGGSLELALLREGAMVRVDVSDTGIGIPPEALSHIFDRFYRVDKARNRMDGGSGLGLSIARAIAEAHGGSIRVQSLPGRGSTFSVLLPLAVPAVE